jgi:hypothetical protein
LRGTKASISRIAVCLRRSGLAFCIGHTGECSVAGGLVRAGVSRRHGLAFRTKVGGGSSSGCGVDAVVVHGQRRGGRAGAAPGRRAWKSGARGAAPGAVGMAWMRT